MSDVIRRQTTQREEGQGRVLEVGQWYYVREMDGKKKVKWLGCITHIGSNYAELTGVAGEYGSHEQSRFHFDVFDQHCTYEPNAEAIIKENVEKHQNNIARLMDEVKLLTTSLAITPRTQLPDGGETQALAMQAGARPIEEYKEALIKAKEKSLPDLFKKIEKENEKMAGWMKAPMIPLKAAREELQGVLKVIEGRIFNVELYAGLVEEVAQIKEGEPASIETPIHIFQRRAYMDEECLARYDAGGMTFDDVADFDEWIVKPENLNRLLPYERCVLAFRVRRHDKERNATNISEFIKFWYQAQDDKTTFLYIRNGGQVFRLTTGIDFDAQLFPDTERSQLEGKIYAKMWGGSTVERIIGESEYQGLIEEYKKARKKHADKIRSLRKRGVPKNEWWRELGGFSGGPTESNYHGQYREWTPDDVYYDEIAEFVQEQIDRHNRLVIVLQGLIDRSPVFHPHPPYQLWSYESFNQALRLIYDDSRGLTPGEAPDFEAYRARLNASITVGTMTVGQQKAWLRAEAVKENNRRANDWRLRGKYHEEKEFKPEGDPGPGTIAPVFKVSRKQSLTYNWKRERRGYSYYKSGELNRWFTTESGNVLNVDAYTPGDYKIFFEDPRTRAQHLQWAPLLLAAEDYHAGKRKKR